MVSACGSKKVTRANYDKIIPGMTLQEVEAILGKGSKEGGDGSNVAAQFGVDVGGTAPAQSGETYVWESGSKSITITFVNGKTATKKESGL
jgi:hypothetical protein